MLCMCIKLYFYSFVADIGGGGDSKLVTGKDDMQQPTTSIQSEVQNLWINYLYNYKEYLLNRFSFNISFLSIHEMIFFSLVISNVSERSINTDKNFSKSKNDI